MTKKLLSLFLALSMAVLCIPKAAFAADYGENIALGKNVVVSGIYSDGYRPEYINDGQNTTAATGTGVMIDGPKDAIKEYIGVDLGEAFELSAVIVRTRRDLQAEWGRIISGVYIANKDDFSDMVKIGAKNTAGEFGSDLEIELEEGVSARYVILPAGAYADLEVYGKKYVPFVEGVYDDVPENYSNAVRIASKLGIMSGVKNGKFGTVNLVTRGEAAHIANSIMGGTQGTYNNEFSDVSENHEYASDIASALNFGIISRDNMFRPDDYVTNYEFFAMLLRVNGFYSASEDGKWYNDVLGLADNYKLSKGIEQSGNYVNRGNAAMAVYNLLMGKYLEEDFNDKSYKISEKSYLEDKFHKKFSEGIVTANAVTSLSEEQSSGKNYIKIGNNEYSLEDPSTGAELLGKAVCYLTDDEETELIDIWVNYKKTNSTELETKNVDSTSKSNIKVTVDNKSANYKLDSNAYYLKNGVACSDIKYNSMAPKYGSIRLTDFDGDNVYEVVEIREPQIVEVSAALYNEDEQKISLSGSNNYKRVIKFDAAYAYENGIKCTLGDIKSGMVVYAYVSESEKYAEFEICRNQIMGAVSECSDDNIVIDGNSYTVSEYFSDNYVKDIVIGAVYTFGIDNSNEIICIAAESSYAQDEKIVVITKCYIDDDGESIYFDMYTENGKFEKFKASNKCKADGTLLNSDFFGRVGKDYFVSKPAIIKINSGNEITSIITPALERLAKRNESIKGCRVGRSGFFLDQTFVLPTCHDTVSFSIPVDTAGKPKTDNDSLGSYSVNTLDKRYSINRNGISSSENVLLYGSDDDGLPIAAITQIEYPDVGGFGVITEIENWKTILVDNIIEGVNSDNDTQYRISGWDLTSGSKVDFTTSASLTGAVNTFKAMNYTGLYDDVPTEFQPDSGWFKDTKLWNENYVNKYFIDGIDTIKRGDIIRYGFRYNKTQADQLEIVLKRDKLDDLNNAIVYSAGDLPNTIFSSYRLQKVKVTKCSKGRVSFTLPDGSTENYALSDFTGTLLMFDGKYSEKHNVSDAESYIGSGERALIFSCAGVHRSIIVY